MINFIYGMATFLILALVSLHTSWALKDSTAVITVAEKYQKRAFNGADSFFVVSEEGEVFENTDSIWFLKFNSADVQAHLKVGEKYFVRCQGYRLRPLSLFRNIVDVLDMEKKGSPTETVFNNRGIDE